MSRWCRLWRAVKMWWRNEYPEWDSRPTLYTARKFLAEYDELYTKRTNPNAPAHYSGQAAQAIAELKIKRAPGLESEIRVLAITVERILTYLEGEDDMRRMTR